jgi:hypothetical protein
MGGMEAHDERREDSRDRMIHLDALVRLNLFHVVRIPRKGEEAVLLGGLLSMSIYVLSRTP